MSYIKANRRIILSIIVPVYKVENYVEQCLSSILNEYTIHLPIEVIVVNDGTPDNSMEIVYKFTKYAILKIINQHNQGLSVARNTGLTNSIGEYVWFIDSDDWLVDGAINRVMNILASEDTPDVIAMGLIWKYGDERNNWVDISIGKDLYIDGKSYLEKRLASGAIQRFIIRSSILNNNNVCFYPNILHEDGIFGKQIIYLATSIIVLKEPLYYYRQRQDGSIMHSLTIKSGYDIITVHKQLIHFCNTVVKEQDRDWFRLLALDTLVCAISFIIHLRRTEGFKKFLKESKHYRQEECNYCMYGNGIKVMLKCFCLKYFPIQQYYIIKIIDFIRNRIFK